MPSVLVAIFYAIFAGIMNGSFALPTKYSQPWRFENIWFGYALFGFLILPWVTLFLLDPRVITIYHLMPTYTLFIILLGGVSFGIGQACFARALEIIGFGLGFVINIGLGTGLGFLLPLVILHPEQILSPIGLATLIGTVFIIIGLLLSFKAGQQRDTALQLLSKTSSKAQYHAGVLLSIIAGLSSAGQNFTFALTGNMQQIALASGIHSLASAIIIWPVFLLCSFIAYGGYMLYSQAKNNSFKLYIQPGSGRNWIFACIMGLLWYVPLVFYSKSSLLIGKLGPIVVWPLFMVLIILASNFWGWRHKEWEHCQPSIKRKALIAIMALIVAVMVLAYSATLSLG
ncbi:MAG TPA: L-rhamnose/proton symporter RhaT [Gammaproteobacteria bacterium]|nr:L-rhamnose/proton symporter RhaT [Gammaproteobacteria bacterium]